MEIFVVTDEIIRVRLAPHSVFSWKIFRTPYQNSNKKAVHFELVDDELEYRISTAVVNCHIRKKDFFISFSDSQGHVTSSDAVPMHWEENVKFGGYYVFCTKVCGAEESFFGLGDKPTEFNLRGKRLKNWNTDAYSFAWNQDPLYRSIPFYITLK